MTFQRNGRKMRRMTETSLFLDAKSQPMPDLVRRFLDFLQGERAASHHTLVNYEIDLRHWLKFLFQRESEAGKGDLDIARLVDLHALREFLSAEMHRYERTTVSRRLSV